MVVSIVEVLWSVVGRWWLIDVVFGDLGKGEKGRRERESIRGGMEREMDLRSGGGWLLWWLSLYWWLW